MGGASPASTSTRQVVHRALPPQRWRMSIPASSIARTSFFPASTSNAFSPSTVTVDINRDLSVCRSASQGAPGRVDREDAHERMTSVGAGPTPRLKAGARRDDEAPQRYQGKHLRPNGQGAEERRFRPD